MPHVLTFSDDRHFGYLTTAIDQLRINLVAGRSIAIDFYATYKVSPQAMLFLLAEVDRLVHLFGVPRFKTITPRSPKVQEVFKQTGLYATLGVESDIQPKREDVIHWAAMSGSRVKSEVSDPLSTLYSSPQFHESLSRIEVPRHKRIDFIDGVGLGQVAQHMA